MSNEMNEKKNENVGTTVLNELSKITTVTVLTEQSFKEIIKSAENDPSKYTATEFTELMNVYADTMRQCREKYGMLMVVVSNFSPETTASYLNMITSFERMVDGTKRRANNVLTTLE